ncbi:MAG: two-component system response regulator [Candidatus Eremiobacteraeota bacterium]|nr:two-component system response regulator [Candidatus Eremiobacteraeota bacterium]
MSEKPRGTVLIVDDTEANIDILVESLGDDFELRVAMDGQSALDQVAEEVPDIILLDIMMPGMDGYEVCEKLKAAHRTRLVPVIFLTAMTEAQDEKKGLDLGAVDYITKPFNPGLVKARVRNHLELKRYRDHLEDLVAERTKEITLMQEVIIESLAGLAEYRDPETGGHIRRTKNYVLLLAKHLMEHNKYLDVLNRETVELLYMSAPLHDIGKVGVPDSILMKPGKLTDEEFAEMKKHTIYGRDAIMTALKRLGENSFLRFAREIAESHQEKWDGSGYPNGLKGEDIPVSGRLMAIADVYDALISKRVYKMPFTHSKAVGIIREGRGTHFDPGMVDAFLELQEEFRKVAIEFADFEEERHALAEAVSV